MTTVARIFGLLLLVSLVSCATLSPIVAPENLRPIQKRSLASLNGTYATAGVNAVFDLDGLLLPGQAVGPSYGRKKVIIKALDQHHLQIRLVDSVGTVAERVCKVWVRQGYCKLATHRHYFSDAVIINGYTSSVARISLLQNGSLTVDAAHGGVHFVLILPIVFPESFHRNAHLEFRRISD